MFLRNKERFICRINENSTLYFSFKNRQDKKLRPYLINFLDKIDKNRIKTSEKELLKGIHFYKIHDFFQERFLLNQFFYCLSLSLEL